jgi:hypothetical protein
MLDVEQEHLQKKLLINFKLSIRKLLELICILNIQIKQKNFLKEILEFKFIIVIFMTLNLL